MNQKTITIIVIFFALVIAGMFTFAFLKKSEITSETEPQNEDATEETKYAYITRIDGTHYFIDGIHTVVGELAMPTPCDLLEVESIIADSSPEQVTLDFDVINNASFCAEQITAQRFKVTAKASEDATFDARFMGRSVELNLVPAAPGETPDEFEVFIKG